MNYTTVGTCSICGGPVVVPIAWYGVVPPVPTCQSCGAYAKEMHGPVIPMCPNDFKITYSGNTVPKVENVAQDSGAVPKGKSLLVD